MKLMAVVDQPISADKVNAALKTNLKSVARWSTPVLAVGTGAGAAVTVSHDLNAVPNVIDIEAYVDARYWADQDDRAGWNNTQVIFRTSHQGTFIVRAGVQ